MAERSLWIGIRETSPVLVTRARAARSTMQPHGRGGAGRIQAKRMRVRCLGAFSRLFLQTVGLPASLRRALVRRSRVQPVSTRCERLGIRSSGGRRHEQRAGVGSVGFGDSGGECLGFLRTGQRGGPVGTPQPQPKACRVSQAGRRATPAFRRAPEFLGCMCEKMRRRWQPAETKTENQCGRRRRMVRARRVTAVGLWGTGS